ncbi:MAG: hypothetical protein IPL39_14450 [Opitutaceae bacterium]|nr:hypothetical protein [Opitutaceae bacterium]
MNAQVNIVRDEATPALQALSYKLAPDRRRPFALVLGRKTEGIYRTWFRRGEGDSANKKGWPRQHFWARMAKRTALVAGQTTADRAVVTIADPAIQMKVHGGTIVAKQAKFLAIPMRREAYGVRPSAHTMPGIFFIRSKRAGAFLARMEGKSLRVYWRLVARVTMRPDPRALPPRDQVSAELFRTAEAFVARSLGRT